MTASRVNWLVSEKARFGLMDSQVIGSCLC